MARRIVRDQAQQPCPRCKKDAGAVKGLTGPWECLGCGAKLKSKPKGN